MNRLVGLILAGALVLPACTVGPDYTKPVVATPDAWHESHVQGIAEGSAHVQTWWTVFDDPLLAELIQDAQESNKDFQGAYFQILEARAIRGGAVGDRYPQVDVTAEASTTEPSESATGLTERVDTFAFGGGLAWEIDLFGRIRRSVETATAQYDASVEDYRDVLVALLGEADQAFKVYEQSVLLALEEVQTAFVAFAQERRRAGQLAQATDATQRAVDLVRTQYVSGLTNLQNVLDTQRTLFELQQQLASSEGQRVQNLVGLYRALGGGWDLEARDVTMPAELQKEADEERLFSIPSSGG